jgi:hypothetical protein
VLKALLTWFLIPTHAVAFSVTVAVLSLLSLFGIPIWIARLPEDHFLRHPVPLRVFTFRWFLRVLKNVLGLVLFVLGILMLVLPGQGILTLFLAILLLDFPRKRSFELWLLRRPRLAAALNQVRKRANVPPLKLFTENDAPE